MVKEAKIYVSKMDLERLTKLIEITRERDDEGGKLEYLDRLQEELDKADVVDPEDVPSDVITMRSKVRLKDLITGEEMVYSLVFPTEANLDEGKISVLAPIGTAMLGYSRGDVIEWAVPSGVRKLKVEKVLYQPESAGDSNL
ncbi:MAG TPA: nucleoside diphosphate kinase regulator [Pyrinomonadaceae bacterium]|nr:nucleoside diphosphate kinase regulator [Pyrinomonadaceae bacterium]